MSKRFYDAMAMLDAEADSHSGAAADPLVTMDEDNVVIRKILGGREYPLDLALTRRLIIEAVSLDVAVTIISVSDDMIVLRFNPLPALVKGIEEADGTGGPTLLDQPTRF